MQSEFYKPLGERIARLRRRLELTQDALGQRMDMSRATVASIEAGRQRVTLDQLYEIATALEVTSLGELISLDLAPYKAMEPSLKERVNSVQAAQIDAILRSALAGATPTRTKR